MQLNPEGASVDLSKKIINDLAEQEEYTATQKAILQLKRKCCPLRQVKQAFSTPIRSVRNFYVS